MSFVCRRATVITISALLVCLGCAHVQSAYVITSDDPAVTYNAAYTFALKRSPIAQALVDYTRVQVPTTSQISINGGWYHQTNDWISVTFIRNGGQPFLLNGNDHWVPLVCLYQASMSSDPVVFQGCYNNVTTSLPRTDLPDPFFLPGTEIYSVTGIIAQRVHNSGPSASVVPFHLDSSVGFDSLVDSYFVQASIDISDDVRFSMVREVLSLLSGAVTLQVPVRVLTYSDKYFMLNGILNTDPTAMPPTVTPQAAAVHTYLKAFVNNNYPSIRPLLAPDMRFEVIGLTNYTGSNVVYAYQLLSSLAVSDVMSVDKIAIETIVQTGATVIFEVLLPSTFPHAPPALQTWNNKYAVLVEFNRYGQFQYWHQHVNLIDAAIRATAPSAANISTICTSIMNTCTSAITLLQTGGSGQVYANETECETYLSSIPLAGPTAAIQVSGSSVACISWHAKLAIAYPEDHCLHASPLKISQTTTPCQNFP